MSKPLKDLITKELKSRLSNVESAMVVNPILLTGVESNRFRGALKAKNIEMHLVKNSLAQRALAGTKLEGIGEILTGPSAVVYGGESIVDVAREIHDWTKKLTKLEVCGAIVDGEVVDAEGAKQLAKMPSRVELQGQIVQLAQSPGARVASAIGAPAGRIAGCIKSLVEKLETPSGAAA
ncbi:MAG: 50S ribosomal protein L10 [Phycisphaerae bacterium]|mgnify:CR=1 FL=1|nr:50S ribosomal protein L10 [Phycisphaerae bacterium]